MGLKNLWQNLSHTKYFLVFHSIILPDNAVVTGYYVLLLFVIKGCCCEIDSQADFQWD